VTRLRVVPRRCTSSLSLQQLDDLLGTHAQGIRDVVQFVLPAPLRLRPPTLFPALLSLDDDTHLGGGDDGGGGGDVDAPGRDDDVDGRWNDIAIESRMSTSATAATVVLRRRTGGERGGECGVGLQGGDVNANDERPRP
jgi:hypothetical protein